MPASPEGSGQGSEFVVRLPVRSDLSTENRPNPPTPSTREPSPGLRVLIVDDNISSTRALARILRRRGRCEVTIAHDGESALALARVQPPQIILLDIGLPDMSGYDLMERLKASGSFNGARFIALSGYRDIDAPGSVKFDHFLEKPLDTVQLETLLQSLAN